MKRLVILCLVLFLAALILLPGVQDGKYKVSKPIVADGYPLPPFPPGGGATFMADGYPLPPFPPGGGATLMADGNPLPPLPPGSGFTVIPNG